MIFLQDYRNLRPLFSVNLLVDPMAKMFVSSHIGAALLGKTEHLKANLF